MAAPRPFVTMRTRDQWLRAAHERTYLDARTDSVELDWSAADAGEGAPSAPDAFAGLAFDGQCRLYHSIPATDRIERLRWAARKGATDPHVEAVDILQSGRVDSSGYWLMTPAAAGAQVARAARPTFGEFTATTPRPAPIRAPRALAVDCSDRLFVAETGAQRVRIFDLWSGRLLRSLALPGVAGPDDLAAYGETVYAVVRSPATLLRLSALRGPFEHPLDSSIQAPSRIAVSPSGQLVLLDRAGQIGARVVPLASVADAFDVPFAADVEFESEQVLVVGRQSGADLQRFRSESGFGASHLSIEELPPLRARGYDGLGIVRCPDGSIGFWSAKGFRTAVAARLSYERQGHVSTYRLDSGDFQMQWGRLFMDACIPAGTSVRFECLALDDPPEDEPTLPRTLPTKLVKEVIRRPDLSPPMPPLSLVPATDERFTGAFHRRESGCELPWSSTSKDAFVTYEAPIRALAGRYLWVFLELTGNTKLSPRVRSLRAEHPSHDLLRRLPATFSRSTASADFLRRFLAMFEGLFSELEGRSAIRESLVLPRATPEDLLPWLSRFVGLTLDERWSSDVRRTFIEEAIELFRFRGTLRALERMLHIALGIKPTLLEHFRVRGMGGAIVGAEGAAISSAVLGGGMRVGGQIGFGEAETPVFGTLNDAFELHAHRFSVIVPRALTLDELECARFILDEHRPAHTLYDICTTDAGMRAGIGAHVGLSAVVGRTGGFATVQLGNAALGRGAIIGRPRDGVSLGNTRLGAGSRLE